MAQHKDRGVLEEGPEGSRLSDEAPDRCLGHWDALGDFDYEHEFAGQITCDECKHGAAVKYGFKGLDPRLPRDQQDSK